MQNNVVSKKLVMPSQTLKVIDWFRHRTFLTKAVTKATIMGNFDRHPPKGIEIGLVFGSGADETYLPPKGRLGNT